MDKYILVVTLPSGNHYALSTYEGGFALVPFDGFEVKNALAFDSYSEALVHRDKQIAVAPDLEKKMGLIDIVRMSSTTPPQQEKP